MAFRVKYNWTQQSAKLGGWSTNFWSNGSDLSVVRTKAISLLTKLNEITGIQAVVTSFTVADYASTRNVMNVENGTTPPTAVTEGNDADYPSAALFIRLQTAQNYRTGQWIRGIPDQNISNSGRYVPKSGYAKAITAFFAELKDPGNLWAVHVLDRATPKKVITGLNTTTGVVTCPAHGYGAAGTTLQVRIKGFSTPKDANGLWRITVIDANTFQLSFWTALDDSTVKGKNPTSTAQTYILQPVASGEVIRASSHYTGRPTGLLGGRRRSRRRV